MKINFKFDENEPNPFAELAEDEVIYLNVTFPDGSEQNAEIRVLSSNTAGDGTTVVLTETV